MFNPTLNSSIQSLSSGTVFTIKDLSNTYWSSLPSDTARRMLGKEFNNDVLNGIYTSIVFIGKNHADIAIYKKI